MTRDDLLLLARVQIAEPCTRSWYAMRGDDRVRYCAGCHQNVYDLSELTANDARELLNRREGRLCVRLWRRSDGTVITRDCGEGQLARMRRRIVARVLTQGLTILTVLLAMAGITMTFFGDNIRRLLSMNDSMGALAGDPVPRRGQITNKDMKNFGPNDYY